MTGEFTQECSLAARRESMTRTSALAGLLALVAWGCSDEPAGSNVRICGDLAVPVEVDSLRVVVRRADRTEAFSAVRTLADPVDAAIPDAGEPDAAPGDGGAPDASLSPEAGPTDAGPPDAALAPSAPRCVVEGPRVTASVALPPISRDAWVEVIGLRAGVQVISAEVRASGGPIVVPLHAACLGVRCLPGQTCVDGACAAVPLAADAPPCEAACSP
jgi:hypothetical protein